MKTQQPKTYQIRSDQSLSRVRLLATPWTVAHQAPPSMGFSRREYWSGVPLPSPNLPLSTAFTESHRFGVVVFSFSFISMHILISFLIFAMVSFVSFAFISALIFKISFPLLTLGFFLSFFSSYFRCRVRLFI